MSRSHNIHFSFVTSNKANRSTGKDSSDLSEAHCTRPSGRLAGTFLRVLAGTVCMGMILAGQPCVTLPVQAQEVSDSDAADTMESAVSDDTMTGGNETDVSAAAKNSQTINAEESDADEDQEESAAGEDSTDETVSESGDESTDGTGSAAVDEPADKAASISVASKESAETDSLETSGEETSAEEDVSADSFSDADIKLLATLIYCEAGNQPYTGQVAVGSVVMNRMKSSRFPSDLSGVIYQRGQFGPAMTGWLGVELQRSRVTEACYRAAKDAMNGSKPVGNAVFFMGVGAHKGTVIGAHVFWGSL